MLTLLAKVAVGIRWCAQLRLFEKDLMEKLWTRYVLDIKRPEKIVN